MAFGWFKSVTESPDFKKSLAQRSTILNGGASEGVPVILRPPWVKTSDVNKTQYASYDIGDRPYMLKRPKHKVLMVVGETGTGKSTLINAMINHILKVQYEDGFRFKIVVEEQKSQTHSQTQIVTSYTIYGNKNHNIPHTLTIIDTPGFGDTRGVEQDDKITRLIQEFFSQPEIHHVDHIDAIGFVVKGSDVRLTLTQKYVFNSILSLFGKDVAPNIIILATFCDEKTPLVMQAVKEANITQNDTFFTFNNVALFTCKAGQGGDDSSDDEDADHSRCWKKVQKNMRRFFLEMDKLTPKSLTLTNEVLRERENLEATRIGLEKQIKSMLCKQDALQQEQRVLERNKSEITANTKFKYTVNVEKKVKTPLSDGKYANNCSKCEFTCHVPCPFYFFQVTSERFCCAIELWSGKCSVCPDKCKWGDHLREQSKFETQMVTEERTYADMEMRYKEASGKKLTVEQVVQRLQDEVNDFKEKAFNLMMKCRNIIKRLEQIALQPNPITDLDFIELMIRQEQNEGQLGWEGRVVALENLKKKSELLEIVQMNEPIID